MLFYHYLPDKLYSILVIMLLKNYLLIKKEMKNSLLKFYAQLKPWYLGNKQKPPLFVEKDAVVEDIFYTIESPMQSGALTQE